MKDTKSDGRIYSPETRMMVFDAIVNQVPTNNIPKLIQKYSLRSGLTLKDVPHRTTVEAMARELDAIAELQTAEAVIANKDCTLGFDANTQEGVHVNSLHFTTALDCYAAAVDEFAGGTAEDYQQHICDSVDSMASVYAHFHEKDSNKTRENIIYNISNTMTDRCAANHAAIQLVNAKWDETLNELNCHLRPLDSIATKTRAALKQCEQDVVKKLWGSDCLAGNIVLQMNKMRYKDSKWDPRGFKTFLVDHHLPRGLIPNYRGNRLHVLFHICGILIEHHPLFQKFLEQGTTCGGLRASILVDFISTSAHVEMQVLGLLGKVLTGPWMRKFYTSVLTQTDHVEGILLIKEIITQLKEQLKEPLALLSCTTDFFGNVLH